VPVFGGFFGESEHRTQAGLRCAITFGALTFLLVESIQMYKKGWHYFNDFWNYISWTSNIISLIIVFDHGAGNLIS